MKAINNKDMIHESVIKRLDKAVTKTLTSKGYVIIYDNYEGFVVAEDLRRNETAFIEVFASRDDFYEKIDRAKFEKALIHYTLDNKIRECGVRYDVLSVVPLGSQAAARHHKGVSWRAIEDEEMWGW